MPTSLSLVTLFYKTADNFVHQSCYNRTITMNTLKLVAVFILGLISAFLCSFLYNQIQSDRIQQQSSREAASLLESRRSLLEKAKSLVSLPEVTQFSVVDDPLNYESLLARLSDNQSKKVDIKRNTVEALATLHAAVEMNKHGKRGKAIKLFQHALALDPEHPDILTHYGEFLETIEKNLVAADYHYSRALTFSPNHHRALENRQRTMPLVDEIDDDYLRSIDKKRDDLLAIPESSARLRRIKKEAYFQHIYHTAGIEGNTMSLAQTRMIVETRVAVGGKSIVEHNEILGLDAALKYINSSLVHRIGAITLDDILEIHKRVLGFVDPTEGGKLRSTQVFVGSHIPPGPSELHLLMEDFVQWLNSAESLHLHPIKFAALAHYKLVHIHPFSDGNGRTSRLLMNLILMQAGYPPVIIRKQDRASYYDYIQQANEGDVRPFVRFIAQCAEQTLDVYLWAIADYGTIPALAQEDDGRTIVAENR